MLKPTDSIDEDRIARFLRETRIAAMLDHPHVARVLDSGSDETGTPFLVMELLEGRSLEQELTERNVLGFQEALSIALPIAGALAAAHALGVIHRDVKPSNIFLCRQGASISAKLVDFGIARSPRDAFETRAGLFVGTPGYVAPEQARDGECGPFTDVWGVGAVLYRCLTGRPPHAGGSIPEMLARLVRESVPPLVVNGVKRSTCAAIDRALERDPQRRYQTMQAFIRALEISSTGDAGDFVLTDELPGVSTAAFEVPDIASYPAAEVSLSGPTKSPTRRSSRKLLGLAAVGALGIAALLVPRPVRDRSDQATALVRGDTSLHAGRAESSPSFERYVVAVRPDTHEVQAVAESKPADRRATSNAAAHRVAPRTVAVHPSPNGANAGADDEPERERNTGLPVPNEW
jgi:serine/threonine protein kinase